MTIDKELTFRQHVDLTVSKAKRSMGLIRRSFINLDGKSFSMLFKTSVRNVLEYNYTICHHFSYPKRLKAVNLPTLAFRRLREDMIQVNKYLNDKYDDDATQLFSNGQRDFHSTHGHKLKLVKSRSRLNFRKNFFTERCISTWNSLPKK